MKHITVTHLARNLADVVSRVFYRGDSFLVMRGGRPAAQLTPPPRARRLGDLVDIFERLPGLSEEDAESMASDVNAARSELGPAPTDPWDS